MRRAGLAAVGACMLLAACGGGSDDATDTVVEVPTTTEPPPTATTVETTTTTSSTTTTTTSTTTTVAPRTTLSPEQEAIAAAEEAVVNAFEARTAALVDPSNPDLREDLANYWTDAAVPSVLEQVDDFAVENMVLRISGDPVSFVRVVGQSALVEPDRVQVRFCRLDSNVIMLAEQVGGVDVIVDDSVTTRIWEASVFLENGEWRVAGADVLAEADGQVGCDELL